MPTKRPWAIVGDSVTNSPDPGATTRMTPGICGARTATVTPMRAASAQTTTSGRDLIQSLDHFCRWPHRSRRRTDELAVRRAKGAQLAARAGSWPPDDHCKFAQTRAPDRHHDDLMRADYRNRSRRERRGMVPTRVRRFVAIRRRLVADALQWPAQSRHAGPHLVAGNVLW
jgi:hypothetical protein